MENYSSLVSAQQLFFQSDRTKDITFRVKALQTLRNAIKNHENELLEALRADLNKSEFEAYSTEIGFVLEELRFTISRLHSWVKPQKVKTPITHLGSESYIHSEPYGVTLIIAPWNYPFQLAIAPLIGAISAGNCAVMKPSELTPKTSEILEKLITEYFPKDYISVVQGGIETSQALLMEPFDYIFFTGSVPVGKIIMEAAAKNLTPVTLELGGKSPCIVHDDAHLKLAAKRIAWGKYTNAGQTCIAPDYLYIHKNVKDEFLNLLKQTITELYGSEPLDNPNFTRIVSERHFDRLSSFLSNGEIYFGGKTNREKRLIEPTVLIDITWDEPIMQDEIFGPIFPVLEYTDLSEVIIGIHHHPKPLSLYIFTENNEIQKKVVNSISFGGGCVNDTVYHFASPHLPFGGVGPSGIGSYHGKGSYDAFSHKKSILKQTTRFDIPFRYPNVKNGLKKIKMFMK
ncbi:aldehyde dehydrogenase [Neobacillus mesonae]|uniref:aldehyde dehydrogenase n=1 Tax=Neobacillus mesonae TaxID=1193713 RepID=UPI00203C88A7|nr:aldehyde dehydrogenase [Neobacillus mesonae]MCM3567702.1 aldehyde dehydrogenase [Neobacillus mesonae]